MSYPFRLTNKAIRILDLHSVEEAKRLNHDMLTPEHVLLGIFHETDSIVVNVLNKLTSNFCNTSNLVRIFISISSPK